MHRAERTTTEIFNTSIASSMKLSSLFESSFSFSNDLLKSSSVLK